MKGFTICASGTPSIPSRYLTIISTNSERQGFQQTAKRFQYDLVCHRCISLNEYHLLDIEFYTWSWSISNSTSIR
jgi:hypothetical protein